MLFGSELKMSSKMTSSYKNLVKGLKQHRRLFNHTFSFKSTIMIIHNDIIIKCNECDFQYLINLDEMERSNRTSKDPELKIFNTKVGPSILVRSINHDHDVTDHVSCGLCCIEELMME